MLALLFNVYSLIVFLAVIASWLRLPQDHPLVRLTSALTEPLLAPIRRVLPSVGGLDFSPLVLLFGLRLLERLVV
ncbi:MAG TPA: YggT family protein [Polyangiaceae bacterium]|jgi:YggT family protein|nr:YggT family protein [Polyangiaceae bacterium]